jgi:DNA-binding NarL/FixJ family response regulator
MTKIEVLVLGTEETRVQIAELLQYRPDMEVVTGDSVVRHSRIVVLEVAPELPDTMTLLEQMQAELPPPQFVILAHQLDMAHVRQVVDLGVMGYFLTGSNLDGLEAAIRLVASGKFAISPPITQLLLSRT